MRGIGAATRAPLVTLLHALLNDIDEGLVTVQGYEVRSQEGEGSVLTTGRRKLVLVWDDERMRHVIR